MKKIFLRFVSLFCMTLLLGACATSSPYLKGVHPDGSKVYLGPLPIEETDAFKTFMQSDQGPVQEQQYLFQRLKEADQSLKYYHDGNWYSWLEAYRGGNWLVRNRYQKGQDTRTFLKKYVLRSEDKKELHLIKYPDGSIQIGYDVLMNELDLLEKTVQELS